MNEPLTGKDMMTLFNNRVKIVLYSDLGKYDNIDQLLEPYDVVIILYEFERFYGHWTILYRYDGQIYFFDSYGYILDDELDLVPMNFRIENDMVFPHLTYLLSLNGGVDYNQYKFQKSGGDIATCGRWCYYRYENKHLSTDEFHDLIKRQKKLAKKLGYELANDELVVLMTTIDI